MTVKVYTFTLPDGSSYLDFPTRQVAEENRSDVAKQHGLLPEQLKLTSMMLDFDEYLEIAKRSEFNFDWETLAMQNAGPDLLSALRQLISSGTDFHTLRTNIENEEDQRLYKFIRKTIKKAKGEL